MPLIALNVVIVIEMKLLTMEYAHPVTIWNVGIVNKAILFVIYVI